MTFVTNDFTNTITKTIIGEAFVAYVENEELSILRVTRKLLRRSGTKDVMEPTGNNTPGMAEIIPIIESYP